MKRLGLVAALLFGTAVEVAHAERPDPRVLQAKVNLLESVVAKQKREIEQLRKELAEARALARKRADKTGEDSLGQKREIEQLRKELAEARALARKRADKTGEDSLGGTVPKPRGRATTRPPKETVAPSPAYLITHSVAGITRTDPESTIRRHATKLTAEQCKKIAAVDGDCLAKLKHGYQIFCFPNKGKMWVTWSGYADQGAHVSLRVWDPKRSDWVRLSARAASKKDGRATTLSARLDRPATEETVYVWVNCPNPTQSQGGISTDAIVLAPKPAPGTTLPGGRRPRPIPDKTPPRGAGVRFTVVNTYNATVTLSVEKLQGRHSLKPNQRKVLTVPKAGTYLVTLMLLDSKGKAGHTVHQLRRVAAGTTWRITTDASGSHLTIE